MRSKAILLVTVLIVAALFGGVTASSVTAATKTTVTWNVSSFKAGWVIDLSAVASTNSRGVKTWSKKGSCTLTPKRKPTKFTMGSGVSCTLTLKIAKSGNYPAKTSTKTLTLIVEGDEAPWNTVPPSVTSPPTTPTTTTVAPGGGGGGGGGSPSSNWLGCYFKGTKMAGAVYITDYSWSADFTVYITDYSWSADLTVYETPYSWAATSCGVWYLTPYSWAADFTVYITDYSWSADLEVYVTPYSWAAGR